MTAIDHDITAQWNNARLVWLSNHNQITRQRPWTAMFTGNDTLRLVPHPKARDQAISIKNLEAGSPILSTPSFATVLLATQKDYRCDACFRLPADGTSLRRCTGCGSYWYCDVDCLELQFSFRIIAYLFLQVKLSNGVPIIS